jgi:hypothetical protein
MNNLFLVIIISIFVLGNTFVSFSQIDNSPFYRNQEISEENKDNLYLSLSHLSFNKDNEYFNKIADGYTLFGNQLSTTFVYFPASNVRLEGGIYLRKDFGNSNYSEIAPVMSVKIEHENMALIFGTLEGSLNHNLVEPLYDFEKTMLNKNENGIQFLLNKQNFDLDLWINWEKMLYTGDSIQEELTGGLSTEYRLIDNENNYISIPFQFTAMHLGGQIDASDLPLTSKLNSAVGIKAGKNFSHHFFKSILFEPYFLYYNDFSFEKQDVYENGYGTYLNLSIETKMNTIMISYWEGNEYISTHGGLLYNSRSTTYKNPFYTEQKRQLLILRFLTDIKIFDGLDITSRFEPFYDFNTKQIEFSLGLYINYHDDFFLKKISRN